MKVLTKIQPWSMVLLLLSACFNVSGQSTSNFNVTVTESSAGCIDPPCFSILEVPSPELEFCNVEEEENEAINPNTVVSTSFDFDIYLGYSGSVFDNESYYLNVSVSAVQPDGSLSPVLLNTGSFQSTSTNSGQANVDEEEWLHLNMDIEFDDPGNCEFVFRFELLQLVQAGEEPDITFKEVEFNMVRCGCYPGNQNTSRNGNPNGIGQMDLKVFPNPFQNEFVVVEAILPVSKTPSDQAAVINLYDICGRMVYNMDIRHTNDSGIIKEKLMLDQLQPGIYLLELKKGSYVQTKKIVKQ